MLLHGTRLGLFLTEIHGGCGGLPKSGFAAWAAIPYLSVPNKLQIKHGDGAAWHDLGGGVSGTRAHAIIASPFDNKGGILTGTDEKTVSGFGKGIKERHTIRTIYSVGNREGRRCQRHSE